MSSSRARTATPFSDLIAAASAAGKSETSPRASDKRQQVDWTLSDGKKIRVSAPIAEKPRTTTVMRTMPDGTSFPITVPVSEETNAMTPAQHVRALGKQIDTKRNELATLEHERGKWLSVIEKSA